MYQAWCSNAGLPLTQLRAAVANPSVIFESPVDRCCAGKMEEREERKRWRKKRWKDGKNRHGQMKKRRGKERNW